MIIDTINNFNLIRGARPQSLDEMKALNCKTIINLETGWFELLHKRNYEEDQWAKECGAELDHLPMSDFSIPTKDEVDLFQSLVKLALNAGNVYFHCLFGKDRTGYQAAAWRILQQGWTVDAAINEMMTQGYHSIPYFYWVPSLRRLK